ncbi:MAG: hypothetical protein ACRD0P_05470 [Stackebrandtia sp.]
MSDATTTEPATTETEPKPESDKGFPEKTPVTEMTPEQQVAYWKDKARKHESRASAQSDYEALKQKANEFDKLTEAQKSDLERLQSDADKYKSEAEKLQSQVLKRDVADAKGLPKGWASRLVGDTQAELEADADNLLADLKPATKPDPDQGARGKGKPQPTVSSGRDLYAQRKHKTTT